MSNGVPIKDFTAETEQSEDEELLFLVKFIEDSFAQEDIRVEIEAQFGFGRLSRTDF